MMNSIGWFLGIPVDLHRSSFKYLWIPISLKWASQEDWENVIQKIRKRVHSWGVRWLNLVRRVILIKYVLSSLPVYLGVGLLVLSYINQQISRLIQKLLWKGGKGNDHKFQLVNWNLDKQPKNLGGLAIKDLELMNLPLGTKLVWKLLSHSNEWWKKAFIRKYFYKNHLTRVEDESWEEKG